MSVEHNFKVYRETVAQDSGSIMAVPYLPPHLRDVLTVYEMESEKTESGLFSLRRLKLLGSAMHQVLRFAASDCRPLPSKNARLHDFLATHLAFMSEEKLDTLSSSWQDRLRNCSEEKSCRICRLLVEDDVVASSSHPVISSTDFVVLVLPVSHTVAELKVAIESLLGCDCKSISLCEVGVRIPIEDDFDLAECLTSSALPTFGVRMDPQSTPSSNRRTAFASMPSLSSINISSIKNNTNNNNNNNNNNSANSSSASLSSSGTSVVGVLQRLSSALLGSPRKASPPEDVESSESFDDSSSAERPPLFRQYSKKSETETTPTQKRRSSKRLVAKEPTLKSLSGTADKMQSPRQLKTHQRGSMFTVTLESANRAPMKISVASDLPLERFRVVISLLRDEFAVFELSVNGQLLTPELWTKLQMEEESPKLVMSELRDLDQVVDSELLSGVFAKFCQQIKGESCGKLLRFVSMVKIFFFFFFFLKKFCFCFR